MVAGQLVRVHAAVPAGVDVDDDRVEPADLVEEAMAEDLPPSAGCGATPPVTGASRLA